MVLEGYKGYIAVSNAKGYKGHDFSPCKPIQFWSKKRTGPSVPNQDAPMPKPDSRTAPGVGSLFASEIDGLGKAPMTLPLLYAGLKVPGYTRSIKEVR